MKRGLVILHIDHQRFLSAKDEAHFFKWATSIRSITSIEGTGATLYLAVDLKNLRIDDLREIMALFYRYDVPMTQLAALQKKAFADWFGNKRAYWFSRVFPSRRTRAKAADPA